MSEVWILLIALAIFAGGYLIMDRIDRFLDRSFRSEPPAYQQQHPSSVMLTEDLSDEELIRSIRLFAAQHEQICIILRDSKPDGAGGNAA